MFTGVRKEELREVTDHVSKAKKLIFSLRALFSFFEISDAFKI